MRQAGWTDESLGKDTCACGHERFSTAIVVSNDKFGAAPLHTRVRPPPCTFPRGSALRLDVATAAWRAWPRATPFSHAAHAFAPTHATAARTMRARAFKSPVRHVAAAHADLADGRWCCAAGDGFFEAKISADKPTPFHGAFWLQSDQGEIDVLDFSHSMDKAQFTANFHCACPRMRAMLGMWVCVLGCHARTRRREAGNERKHACTCGQA